MTDAQVHAMIARAAQADADRYEALADEDGIFSDGYFYYRQLADAARATAALHTEA